MDKYFHGSGDDDDFLGFCIEIDLLHLTEVSIKYQASPVVPYTSMRVLKGFLSPIWELTLPETCRNFMSPALSWQTLINKFKKVYLVFCNCFKYFQ